MRLQAVRRAGRVSQEEMARKFKRAKSSICRWEQSDPLPRVDELVQFAAFCGFGPDVARWIGFGGKAPSKLIAEKLEAVVSDAKARARKASAA